MTVVEVNMFHFLPYISKYAVENKERILKNKHNLEKLTVVADQRYFVLQNKDLLALRILQGRKKLKLKF